MGASESLPDRRIVLLGKTGSGKSSAGNTILRKRIFTSDSSPNSVTDRSKKGERKIYGRKLTVIDTPGVFDTNYNEETIRSEIVSTIINCAAGVHAFVIVLKVERYSNQEVEVVDKIIQNCREDIFNNAVVLFTHGENLNDETIEQFVQKSSKLQELVDKCGGRCHVIDNIYWQWCLHCSCRCGCKNNRVQVEDLLETIDTMVQNNGLYTNEQLQRTEQMIQERMQRNTNEDDVTPNQQRERAERAVYDDLLRRFAGASAGGLTGIAMGIGCCVAIPVFCLKHLCSLYRDAGGTAGAAGITAGAAGGTAGAAGGTAGAAGFATTTAGVMLLATGLTGFVVGGANGWHAGGEADSVSDAFSMGATAAYEKGKDVLGRTEEFISLIFNPRAPQYGERSSANSSR